MPPSTRGAAAFFCGLSGFAVIVLMGVNPVSPGWLLVIAAALGAGLAGAVTAPFFGGTGWGGAGYAAIGAALATALGSGFAGLVFGLLAGEPLLGLIYGPVTVFSALAASPEVLLGWGLTMGLTHFGMQQLRQAQGARS